MHGSFTLKQSGKLSGCLQVDDLDIVMVAEMLE